MKKPWKNKIRELQTEVDELRNHIKILEYRLGLIEYKDMPPWAPTPPLYPLGGYPIIYSTHTNTTLDPKPQSE